MSEDHHKAGVGDIFRVYGNDYRSIRNVPASHLKVMQALGPAARRYWEDICIIAIVAITSMLLIIHVATDIALNARTLKKQNGLRHVKAKFYR